MKAGPFVYHAPRTLGEALDLLHRLENPRLLAGGQSLMPMLNFRIAMPDHVIDLGWIEELRGITARDGGLRIGAMTTQREIEKSETVAAQCPLLTEALEHVGHQTTRNRGTIGGSLCHLDPASELPLAAQVLEPTMHIAGHSGPRQIPFTEFAVSHLTTSLEADEILTAIQFPALGQNTVSAFEEFALRPGDFAIVDVAVMLSADANGTLRDVRIAAGGVGPTAVRLADAERILKGQTWSPDRLRAAAEAAGNHPCEGDRNNPAEYRQHLVNVLAGRALTRACAKFGAAVHG